MMSELGEAAIERVRREYEGRILETAEFGVYEVTMTVPPEEIVAACRFVSENGWWHLSTITCQDWGEELELLYHFNGDKPPAITVRTRVPKATPKIASITPQLPAATIYEREAYDMFGVVFESHPNPKRLILPDDWPDDVFPMRLEEIQAQAERDQKEKEENG